jgi:hypothetical protein
VTVVLAHADRHPLLVALIISAFYCDAPALGATDQLWTLWEVGDDGSVIPSKTALDRETCEK